MIAALFFYLFACICVACAVLVFALCFLVFSVLFLFLAFVVLVGGILLAELLLVVGGWAIGPGVKTAIAAPIPANVTNTEALGLVLYTKYVYFFEVAGMVLLVAMVGASVLTLQH